MKRPWCLDRLLTRAARCKSPARHRAATVRERSSALCLIGAAVLVAATQADLPVFTEIGEAAGITFRHSYGDHHLDNIVEGTGAGACAFDYNNDGYQDLDRKS